MRGFRVCSRHQSDSVASRARTHRKISGVGHQAGSTAVRSCWQREGASTFSHAIVRPSVPVGSSIQRKARKERKAHEDKINGPSAADRRDRCSCRHAACGVPCTTARNPAFLAIFALKPGRLHARISARERTRSLIIRPRSRRGIGRLVSLVLHIAVVSSLLAASDSLASKARNHREISDVRH